jgi:peptide chain release factor 1
VTGRGAVDAYRNESGGHRWQQIPKNDDRVQTSTVTVAVLREPEETELVLRDCDLDFQATRGSGAGGQNRNKVSSCIIVTYKPTGLQVRCETERDQHKNKKLALGILRAKLLNAKESSAHAERNEARRAQLGVGARGDKRRTIRTQDDQVTDHVLNKKMRFSAYEKGNWNW